MGGILKDMEELSRQKRTDNPGRRKGISKGTEVGKEHPSGKGW